MSSDVVPAQRREPFERWTDSILRVLGVLFLFLACVLMTAALVYGYRAQQAVNEVRDAFSGVGMEEVPAGDLPYECYDPGSGTVCAPGGADGAAGGEVVSGAVGAVARAVQADCAPWEDPFLWWCVEAFDDEVNSWADHDGDRRSHGGTF